MSGGGEIEECGAESGYHDDGEFMDCQLPVGHVGNHEHFHCAHISWAQGTLASWAEDAPPAVPVTGETRVHGMSGRTQDEWHASVAASHQVEVEKGLHDEQCEFRPNGHFLCLCSKRQRIADGYTEPPGELIHQYPLCPRCLDEAGFDGDSFTCSPCKATWPNEGGPAEFTDDYGVLDTTHWDELAARAEALS